MQISDVRKRVVATIEQAKRMAADRRTRIDVATREYDSLLEHRAVPVFKQVAQVLKAEGYSFSVFTPGGSVRLMSEKSAQDFIELGLDTSGDEPQLVGHTSRSRGRRVIESERPVAAPGRVGDVDEEALLGFLLKELGPFVEK